MPIAHPLVRPSLAWVPVVLLLFSVSAPARPAAAIDLSGTWSIDVHLSDHAEQIARAIEIDTGEVKVERVRGAGILAMPAPTHALLDADERRAGGEFEEL